MLTRILQLTISINYYVVCKLYSLFYYLINNAYPGKLIILTYHSIRDEDVSKFKRHMAEIMNRGEAISLDAIGNIRNGRNYFLITFDDGYQSILKNAIPEMKNNNIPAAIFITTGFLGDHPGWIYNTQNKNKYEYLLTESQIKAKPLSSTIIGSHTVSHPHLNQLRKEELFYEIFESKKDLENITQKTIDSISLPFGSYNNDVIRVIQEAGYKKIFLNIPAKTKIIDGTFIYGRTDVSTDDWDLEFKLKISGAYEWLPVGIYLKNVLLKVIN